MQLLHSTIQGKGQPFLILHGYFGMSDNWKTLGNQFAENYEVHLIDQRNHGRSFHENDFETVHRNTNKTRTNVTQWTMTRTKQYAAENKPVMSSVLEKRCNSFGVSQSSCLFVTKSKTSEVCTHDIGFASLNSSDSSRE